MREQGNLGQYPIGRSEWTENEPTQTFWCGATILKDNQPTYIRGEVTALRLDDIPQNEWPEVLSEQQMYRYIVDGYAREVKEWGRKQLRMEPRQRREERILQVLRDAPDRILDDVERLIKKYGGDADV